MEFYLQYFDKEWKTIGKPWASWIAAWSSLGTDNYHYRVIDEKGNVIKSNHPTKES